MLFTWSTKNLCIVFRQWHVTGTRSLLLSLIAIVLLAAGYEAVREITRRYEQNHNAEMAAFSNSASSMCLHDTFDLALLQVKRLNSPTQSSSGKRIKLITRLREGDPSICAA